MTINSLLSLFVPDRQNNHKAWLVHNYSLWAVTVFVFGLQLMWWQPWNDRLQVLGQETGYSAAEVIALSNQARQSHGIANVTVDQRLMQAAQAKAEDMFAFNYWDHYSPSKRAPWKFILDAGYPYLYAGENLARNYHTAQAVVQAWLDSPSHRENLLNPQFKHIGVAVAQGRIADKDSLVVVQFLAAPMAVGDQTGQEPEFKVAGLVEAATGKIDWSKWWQNPYFTTKELAGLVILVLAVLLSVDAWVVWHIRKLPRISAEYWSHMLFLLFLGYLSWYF